LKLWPNFLARRGSRPCVSGGSMNLEDKEPGETGDDGLHLNRAIVKRSGTKSSPQRRQRRIGTGAQATPGVCNKRCRDLAPFDLRLGIFSISIYVRDCSKR